MPETTSLIRNNLAALLEKHNTTGFIGTAKKQPKPEMLFMNLFQKT